MSKKDKKIRRNTNIGNLNTKLQSVDIDSLEKNNYV